MNKKFFPFTIIVIAILLTAGFMIYYLQAIKKLSKESVTTNAVNDSNQNIKVTSNKNSSQPDNKWKNYQSKKLFLKFQYPVDADIKEDILETVEVQDESDPQYTLLITIKDADQSIRISSYSLCEGVNEVLSDSLASISGHQVKRLVFFTEDKRYDWCYNPLPYDTEYMTYRTTYIRGRSETEVQRQVLERFVSSVELLDE